MTLGGDGVLYNLRSRKVVQKTEPKSKTMNKKKKKKEEEIPWWLKVGTNGKPVDGWLVQGYRTSRKWFIHPSRLPAKWGPYILPDGSFDVKTFHGDKAAFTSGLVPMVAPSERKREARKLARRQPTKCARTALARYNKYKDTDFVLVKAVDWNVLVCRGIWFHINFEAKAQDADCSDPSANRLFFAELTLTKPKKMKVTACVPLGSDDSGGISCIFCESAGKKISHPANEFQRGFTSSDIMKPHICHPAVTSDGIFEFAKWYSNLYIGLHAPRSPRRPAQERKEEKDTSNWQTTECAEIALAQYNKEVKKDFELVEATRSHAFRYVHRPDPYMCFCIHANFKAKPRNADCGDSSPKLFFAELCIEKKVKKATLCTILEPNDFGDHNCRYCGRGRGKYVVLHPVDGYKGYLPTNESAMGK